GCADQASRNLYRSCSARGPHALSARAWDPRAGPTILLPGGCFTDASYPSGQELRVAAPAGGRHSEREGQRVVRRTAGVELPEGNCSPRARAGIGAPVECIVGTTSTEWP